MKALFIGGTGVISTSISRLLISQGWDLTLLNPGNRANDVPGAKQLILDVNDEAAVAKAIEHEHYDTVCDFIAFVPAQAERDIRLFKGRTGSTFSSALRTAAIWTRICRCSRSFTNPWTG